MFINYQYSWFDETDSVAPEVVAGEPDFREAKYLHFSAHEVHDLYARYTFEGGIALYGGVNNLTDEEPDIGVVSFPVSPIGRFYYAGIQWQSK